MSEKLPIAEVAAFFSGALHTCRITAARVKKHSFLRNFPPARYAKHELLAVVALVKSRSELRWTDTRTILAIRMGIVWAFIVANVVCVRGLVPVIARYHAASACARALAAAKSYCPR
jgi:hypothetical protein